MKLIFMGAPGAGKGTQAEVFSKLLGIPIISTGNILKAEMKNGTPLGTAAKEYIDRGALVPDDVVVGIVKSRLENPDCKNGFLFDGFPRTLAQAEALEKMGIKLDRVVDIEVDDSIIVDRISGRRSCPACGNAYHTSFKKPIKDGYCDSCKTALVTRSDDQPETVKLRLKVYHNQTQPLEEYYRSKGILEEVDGRVEPEKVSANIREALGV